MLLALMIFGFMSLILLPLLVSLTKQAIHRCAKCLNEVKSNSYFGYSSMDDKVCLGQSANSFSVAVDSDWQVRRHLHSPTVDVHGDRDLSNAGNLLVHLGRRRA